MVWISVVNPRLSVGFQAGNCESGLIRLMLLYTCVRMLMVGTSITGVLARAILGARSRQRIFTPIYWAGFGRDGGTHKWSYLLWLVGFADETITLQGADCSFSCPTSVHILLHWQLCMILACACQKLDPTLHAGIVAKVCSICVQFHGSTSPGVDRNIDVAERSTGNEL